MREGILSEVELPERLLDQLANLGGLRGAAAHVRINRSRQMTEPNAEWKLFEDLLPFLEAVDDALEKSLGSF